MKLNQKSIKYNWHEADASVMEGVLARGDRRLGQVIRKVYEDGGFFDAWGEHYSSGVSVGRPSIKYSFTLVHPP